MEVEGFDENLSIEYKRCWFLLKLYKKDIFNLFNPDVIFVIIYESLQEDIPNKKTPIEHL